MQVAGFVPMDEQWAAKVADVAASPVDCMVIHGEGDQLITLERSQLLQRTLGPACKLVYTHAGGHLIPSASGAFKQQLVSFAQPYMQSLNPTLSA